MNIQEVKKLAWQIVVDYSKLSENEWLSKYFRPFGKGIEDKFIPLLADMVEIFQDFKILGKYTKEQARSLVDGYVAKFENQI
jgi:hypothetical protein